MSFYVAPREQEPAGPANLDTALKDMTPSCSYEPVREPIEPCRRESGESGTVRLALITTNH